MRYLIGFLVGAVAGYLVASAFARGGAPPGSRAPVAPPPPGAG